MARLEFAPGVARSLTPAIYTRQRPCQGRTALQTRVRPVGATGRVAETRYDWESTRGAKSMSTSCSVSSDVSLLAPKIAFARFRFRC